MKIKRNGLKEGKIVVEQKKTILYFFSYKLLV